MTTIDRRAKELETCSPMYRGVIAKAYKGKASPRGAIKAMCLYCQGYVRAEIAACTSPACPLWEYRPYQAENGVLEPAAEGEISAGSSEIQT